MTPELRFRSTMAVLASILLLPSIAFASPPLVVCGDLPAYPPLAGNPAVVSVTATEQATGAGRAYCNVQLTWQDPELVGSAAGYADPPSAHSFQSIRIGIVLPLNTNTGDAAWGRRLVLTAGGGSQGSVPGLTRMISMTPAAVGAGTDSGHVGFDQTFWGVIVPPDTPVGLNFGKLKDWAGGRSNGVAVKLAKELAKTYYGQRVRRTYWDGCSGGGQMGLASIMNYADEFDGAVIGAPSNHWQRLRLTNTFDRMVYKKVAQLTTPLTTDQVRAASAAATAACDAADGVTDGIVADPRACTWSAENNICGQPNAPDAPLCLDAIQAAGIDLTWDGPLNSHGLRMFPAYDRGVSRAVTTETFQTMVPSLRWNHLDTTIDGTKLYLDRESIDLAAAAGADVNGATTLEDEFLLASRHVSDYADTANVAALRRARDRGVKVLMYHGTQDSLIFMRKSIDFYVETAAHFSRTSSPDFDRLKHWFRLFLTPGAGHCGNQYPGALDAVIDWVENRHAPDSLVSGGKVPKGCPFPQWAIYDGSGDTSDPNSYTCGGNLQTKETICDTLRTPYKHEDARRLQSYGKYNASACKTNGHEHNHPWHWLGKR
ncbi:MAG TPA: tannase/feruloyl esterase family alpha/beta hydrolase [Burkholderiales bacterium]